MPLDTRGNWIDEAEKSERLRKQKETAQLIAAHVAAATATLRSRETELEAQLKEAKERLHTPAQAMRDCTLDELVDNLGPDHLAAKQIAGLRAMVARKFNLEDSDLSAHLRAFASSDLQSALASAEADRKRQNKQQ